MDVLDLELDGGAGLIFLGLLFFALTVAQGVGSLDDPFDELLTLYVAVAALGLAVGGLWLAREGWAAADQRRTLTWSLLGGGYVGALALLSTFDQLHANVPVRDPYFVVLHFAVLGAVGGFVVGFYQSRTRHEERAAGTHLDRFQTLFRNAPLPIVAFTGEGEVTMWNEAAESLFGYDSEAVRGEQTPLVPSGSESEFRDCLAQLRAGNSVDGLRTKRRRHDGSLLDVELWAAPLSRDGDDRADGLVIFRNLTDETLAQQEHTVLKRVLRHNIRNELTIIRGYADGLVDPDADQISEARERILAAADRLISLSEHVGHLQRLDTDIRPVFVPDVVAEAVDAIGEEYPAADISVDRVPAVWIQSVPAISEAFEEAIENGVVHAETPSPTVAVSVGVSDESVRISFADVGPGIPDSEWEPIVEGTEGVLHHSSGLGLWMMQWAAARSGGTLCKSDRDPDGSVVTFSIPQTSSAMRSSGDGSSLPPTGGHAPVSGSG